MIGLLLQGLRNFTRNLKRYRIVLLALVLICALLIVVLGTGLGIRYSVREKASRYFAGDVIVVGYSGDGTSRIEEPETVQSAIETLPAHGFQFRALSRRSTHYEARGIELFFSGYTSFQRRLVGVEWERERPVLARFDFAEGGVPEAGEENAVLISTAAADDLGVRVGDELLVSIRSLRGRRNTAALIVRGIYVENSFFGFTTYMQRRALNRLKEAPPERVNEMGVYLERPGREERAARLLASELGRMLPGMGVLPTRDAYESESHVNRDRRHYGVVTLGAQLAEINDLLGAISIVAGAVIALFLGIVVVGVGNTYTMIVWERRREIGTLRALGMQRARTVTLFLTEALFLGVTGAVLGCALGLGALAAIEQWVSFPPNAATTLFLTQGRLAWEMPSWGIPAIAALAIAASLFGCLRAAVRGAGVRPVEALRHEK